MDDSLKNKWQYVENIDFAKRKPNEWASIYSLKLLDEIQGVLWNEYEWAYYLTTNLKYVPVLDKNNEFEKFSMMELRAQELKRDIFMSADIGERYLLEKENKYIETEWIRRRFSLLS